MDSSSALVTAKPSSCNSRRSARKGTRCFSIAVIISLTACWTLVTAMATTTQDAGLFRFQKKTQPFGIDEGTSALYVVSLLTAPSNDVALMLNQVDSQLSAVTTQLMFTAQNWNMSQDITLHAVDDTIIQMSPYGGVVEVSSDSLNARFNSSSATGVSTTNLTFLLVETDQANVIITRANIDPSPTNIPEGRAGYYDIVLSSRPSRTVAVQFLTRNATLMTVAPTLMIFPPENWNVPQRLTVNALDDTIDRVSPYASRFGMQLNSLDFNYHNLSVPDYQLTLEDNDNDQSALHASIWWRKRPELSRTTATLVVEMTVDLATQTRVRTVGESIALLDTRLSVNTGSGSTDVSPLTLPIVSIHTDLGYIVLREEFTYTFRKANDMGEPWIATVSHCCRRSSLRNNADSRMLLRAKIDLTHAGSPQLPTLAIHPLSSGSGAAQPQAFLLSGLAPSSHPLLWQLADHTGYGSVQAGTPQGVTLDQASGRLSWDTSVVSPGDYSVLVHVSDLLTGTESTIELVLRLTDHSTVAVDHPTIDGVVVPTALSPSVAVVAATVGVPVTLNVTVAVGNASGNDAALVFAGSSPAGSRLSALVDVNTTVVDSDGNVTTVSGQKAMATFTWTPAAAQIGGHIVCAVATETGAPSAVIGAVQCWKLQVRSAAVVPPVVDLNGGQQSGDDFNTVFTEGWNSSVSVAAAMATISSSSSGSSTQILFMAMQLIGVVDVGSEYLITHDFYNPSITQAPALALRKDYIIFEGLASAVEYTTALRNVRYVSGLQRPTVGVRQLVVTVVDTNMVSNEALGARATTTIAVNIHNDAPQVALGRAGSAAHTARFFPGLEPVNVADAMFATVTDPDSLFITSMQVELTNARDAGDEHLAITYKSPERLSLPTLYQVSGLNKTFGRQWQAVDRAQASRRPTGDAVPTASASVTVADDFVVGSVDVVVDIAHSWIGDLELVLEHAGRRQTLVRAPGGQTCAEDDLVHTVFSQSAADGAAVLSSSPLTPGLCRYQSRGVFAAEGDLSVFANASSAGAWTLHATDRSLLEDNGMLTGFGVLLQPLEQHLVVGNEPVRPVASLGGGARELTHKLRVADSGGRVADLHVRLFLRARFADGRVNRLLPSVSLRHPDGTLVALLNCSSSTCANDTQDYNFMLFSDTATSPAADSLTGPCCGQASVFTMSTGAPLFGSNSTDPFAIPDCTASSSGGNDLVNVFQPVEPLAALAGKPLDGTWSLVMSFPDCSTAAEDQTATLDGWGLRVRREPNVDATYNATSGVLELAGVDTALNYQRLLRSVTYSNANPTAEFTTVRRVSITASDDALAASSKVWSDITVHHIYIDLDPQRAGNASTSPNYDAEFVEASPPIAAVSEASATLQDAAPGAAPLYSLSVALLQSADGDSEGLRVTAPLPSALLAEYSMGNTSISVYSPTNVSLPIATFQAILRSIEYYNSAEEISGDERLIDFSVQDNARSGLFFSLVARTTVTMVHVNDAPVLDVNGDFEPLGAISNMVEYREGQGELPLSNITGVVLYDYDNTTLSSVTVTIAPLPDTSRYEIISADLSFLPNISMTRNATGNAELVLSGEDTVENYRQAIATVTYQNLRHGDLIGHPSTAQRSISFTVSDGLRDSRPATVVVTFDAVNDRPLLDLNGVGAGVDFVASFTEERGAVLINSGLTVYDVDNITLRRVTARVENPQDDVGMEVLSVDDEVVVRMPLDARNKAQRVVTLRPTVDYNMTSAVLTVSGLDSVLEYEYVLRTLRYDNRADEPDPTTRHVSVTASDGLLASPMATATVQIILVNDSPYLNGAFRAESNVSEDVLDSDNGGVLVAMADGLIDDDDVNATKGVAATAVDNSNGQWEFTVDGATWQALGDNVTASRAVVLRSDSDNAVRFVPNADFNGESRITFLAWDASSMSPPIADGDDVDSSAVSSVNAFSNNSAQLTVNVIPVNDAPVMQLSAFAMTTIVEDDYVAMGDMVAILLRNTTDVDLPPSRGRELGVAVVAVEEQNGTWQYTQNGGRSWVAMANVSASSAILLPRQPDNENRIRFVPRRDFNGQATFTYLAWDLTISGGVTDDNSTSTANQQAVLMVDTSNSDPITGEFSTQANTATITVLPVNDSPLLSDNLLFRTLAEDIDETINHGTPVSEIVSLAFSDVDVNFSIGIAVTAVDNSNGVFQYTCNRSSVLQWTAFIGDFVFGIYVPPLPMRSRATLLADYCRVRFLPNLDFNTEFDTTHTLRPAGDRPTLKALAWDRTGRTADSSGRYGVDAVARAACVTGEFNCVERTLSVVVSTVNDIPVLMLNATSENYEATLVEDSALGVPVVGDDLTVDDVDHAMLQRVTLVILNATALQDLGNVTVDYSMAAVNDTTSTDPICTGVAKRRQELLVDLSSTSLVAVVRSYCPYVLELSGAFGQGAPVAQYQHALRTLRYNNSIEEPSDQDRAVLFSASDGIDTSVLRYTLLHVQLVNDAPSLDLNGDALDLNYFVNYTEGDDAVSIVDPVGLRILDHDDVTLQWARVDLVNAPDAENEHVNVTLPAGSGIAVAFDVANNSLLLFGEAPLAEYEAVLATTTYTNREANRGFPSDIDRRLEFYVSDGSAVSFVATTRISFTRVNDRPYLDLNGDAAGQDNTQSFHEERGPVRVCASDVLIIDIDNDTLDSVTVSITNIQDSPDEILAVSNLVDMETLSTDSYSQQRLVQRTMITPNTTYDYLRGRLTIRGLKTLDEYRRVLATLTYNNLRDEPDFTPRQIVVTLNDGLLDSVSRTTTMTMVAINDSPVLTAVLAIIRPLIPEDVSSAANAGFSVESMASSLISDDDDLITTIPRKGVAIVAINNTHGRWEYRNQLLASFVAVPTTTSYDMALHLFATQSSELRFVPSADYHGATTLEFVAWDRSNGYQDGQVTNATAVNATDAYSANSRTLELTVVPVNDAPLIDTLAAVRMTSIDEDDRNSSGTAVATLLRAWSNDVDVVPSTNRGVAIVTTATFAGQWEFTVDGGSAWRPVGAVSVSSALVLGNSPADGNRIRFLPQQDFNGAVTLTFKVWDRNSTEASGTVGVDTNTDAVTGPFSVGVATATLTVDAVNDSPRLTSDMELSTVLEDPTVNTGDFVSAMVRDVWFDEEAFNQRGLAVTGVYNGPSRSYGEWQYTCAFGGQLTWQSFKGDITYGVIHPRDPLPAKATLLGPSCRVRFNPVPNYNTEFDNTGAARPQSDRPSLSVKAWDLTAGGASGTYGIDTVSVPYDHTDAFGENVTFAYVSVTSEADAPVLVVGGNATSYVATFVEPIPPLRVVLPVPVTSSRLVLTDADNASLSSVTVVLRAPDTTVYESLEFNTAGTQLTVNTLPSSDNTTLRIQLAPLSGSAAPIGDFQAVLRTMTYENSAEEPDPSVRSVAYDVLDATTFTSVSSQVQIDRRNDPPELDLDTAMTGANNLISYAEGDGAKPVLATTSSFTLLDYDDVMLQSATVTIREAYDRAYEVLAASTHGTAITAVYNGSTLRLTGPDTVANFQLVLANITYSHTNFMPGNPDMSTRYLDFVISDGKNVSLPAATMVTFTAINDRPFLDLNGNASGVDFAVTLREQQGPVLLAAPDAFVIEVDNVTLARATIRITNLLDGAYESLRVSDVRDYSDDITARMLTVTNIYPMQVYDNTTGILVVSGLQTVAEYEKVLRTTRYNNVIDEPHTAARRIEFVLSDGLLDSDAAFATVTLDGVNDSPYFHAAVAVAMPHVAEDVQDASNAGLSVEELLLPLVGDDDTDSVLGLVVVGIEASDGIWQYSLDYTENITSFNSTSFNSSLDDTAANNTALNGTDASNNASDFAANWQTIPASVVAASAVHLGASDERIRVRFVPNRDFNGIVSLTFVAWDRTNGISDGGIGDARDAGLLDAYSNTSTVLTVAVDPVNDAPILAVSLFQLTTILEDNTDSYGNAIVSLVTNASDVDADVQEFGIAVVSTDDRNGSWEVTVDDGASWTTLTNVSWTSATVMRSRPMRQQRVRFSPARDFHGQATFTFVLWDLTDGFGSGTEGVDVLNADAVTGAYSVRTAGAVITVDPVNDSPVLGDGAQLRTVLEDLPVADNTGTRVDDIVAGVYRDVDFSSLTGVGVVGVDNRFGHWEYSCPDSISGSMQHFTRFIGDLQYGVIVPPNPRPEKATLLAGDCRIRFLPVLNFNTLRDLNGDLRPQGDRPFLTIRGWDQTGSSAGRSGRYGQDTTYNNDSHLNEFSGDTRTAVIEITSIDDHPLLTLQLAANPFRYTANFVEDSPFVRIVNSSELTLEDQDHSRMEQITVTLERVYDVDNETITLRPPQGSAVVFDSTTGVATVNISSTVTEHLLVTLRQVAILDGGDNSTLDSGNSTLSLDNSTLGLDNSTLGLDNSTLGLDNSTLGLDNSTLNATAGDNSTSVPNVLYYQLKFVIRSPTGVRVSKESYQAVLRSLVYVNRNTEPNNTARLITFAVDDSEVVDRRASTELFTTLLVDNNPQLTLADTALQFTENQAVPILDLTPGLSLYDYDHNVFYGMASAAVVLDPAPLSANETLTVDADMLKGTNITALFAAATGTLALTGLESVARWESVLQTVMYTNVETEPEPHNRSVTVRVVDTAGLTSNDVVIHVHMHLINDRVPIITFPGPFSVREHPKNATRIGDGLLIADADSGGFLQSRVSIVISNGMDGDFERLQITDPPDSINVTETLYALDLVGPASVADFQQALSSLTYMNTAEEPSPEVRLISVLANDGVFDSTIDFIRVHINLTNDLPIVDLNGPVEPGFNMVINYREGSGPVNIVTRQAGANAGDGNDTLDSNSTATSSLVISDNDHDVFVFASVQLDLVVDAPNEVLAADDSDTNITAWYDALGGTLLLNGTDSLANYQRVLRSVTYEHGESDPGFPDTRARNVTFILSDGQHDSLPVWSLITFEAVNDAPILDLNPPNAASSSFSATFTEEAGPVAIVHAQSMLEDIDSATIESLTVLVLNLQDFGDEVLTFAMTPQLQSAFSSANVSFDPATAALTVVHSATVLDYQSLLRTLRYDNLRDEPDFRERVVQVIANDGELDSTAVFAMVTMVPVNDPPRLNITDDASAVFNTTFTEGDLPVAIVDVMSLLIEDDDDQYLTEMVVTTAGVRDPGYEAVFVDSVALPENFSVGVAIDGCPLPGAGLTDLTLSQNFSISEWTAIVSALRYCNQDQHPVSGERRVSTTLRDPSGAQTRTRVSSVRVQHVNDPPYLNVTDSIPERVLLLEDQNFTVPVLFAFADHEEALDGNAIRVVQQPLPGRVVVNVSTGALDFYPKLDDIGNRTVVFEICDTDGDCSEQENITFVLRPENDPPRTVAPLTLYVDEDTPLSVNLSDYFSDAEDDLLDNGYPRVDIASIAGASKFTFTLSGLLLSVAPFPNDNGPDVLAFTVCDSVGLCTPVRVAVTINSVNDPPSAAAGANPVRSTSTNEDTALLIPITVGDLEDRQPLMVTVLEVGHGTAMPDTSQMTTMVRTSDNIWLQSMHILYRPENDYFGDAAYVIFAVVDADNGTDSARINITVHYDNDPPVFNLRELSTAEDTVLRVALPSALNVTDTEDPIGASDIRLLSDASNGTVTYNPATGALVYAPHLNFFSSETATVTFTLQVCDTNAVNPAERLCTNATIRVNVTSVNDVPPAPALALTVEEESLATIDLYSFLFDVEDGKPPIGNVTLDLVDTRKGTATYDKLTGVVTYTTDAGTFGDDLVRYSVCDSESACNASGTIAVTISPYNDAPVAENFTHASREDDFDLIAIYEHISDNDTQSNRDDILAELRIQLVDGNGAYLSRLDSQQNGILRVYQAHGIVTYQAPNNYVGFDTFRYSVCDRCDPNRNVELGRTSVTDPPCIRQLVSNGNSYIQPGSVANVSITCSEARVDLRVVNVNDVPTVRDISAVTSAGRAVVISPLSRSVVGGAGGKFTDPTAFVYDRDDKQGEDASGTGLNLTLFNLSPHTDVNTTHLRSVSTPVNGTVVTAIDGATGFAELRYTPRAGTYGYDQFRYEVCDLPVVGVKAAACTQAVARLYVTTLGPQILSVTAEGNVGVAEALLDSKFSRQDRITVSFSTDTNMAPVGQLNSVFTTQDIDRMLVFADPFISPITVTDRYQAQWTSRRSLQIDIIDEGYPQPNITVGIWKLGVNASVSPCNGFDPASQLPYASAVQSKYCLLSADGLSLHSTQSVGDLPVLDGTFGDRLPTVDNVVYRSSGVDPAEHPEVGGDYFGAGSEILIFLKPPLSAPQLEELCWYTADKIFNYKTEAGLGAETDLGLSGCTNIMADGTNAAMLEQPTSGGGDLQRLAGGGVSKRSTDDDVLRRRRRQTTTSLTPQPEVSRVILLVRAYAGVLPTREPLDFVARIRRALSVDLLRTVVFRDSTTSQGVQVEPVFAQGAFQQHTTFNTPIATSFVAADPDNNDNVYSVGDTLSVTFDRDTDRPLVGLKAQIDKIFNFSTSIGLDYVGSWVQADTLLITITNLDPAQAVPAIGNLKFSFTEAYLDASRVSSGSYLPTNRPNCIGTNVCGGNETAPSIGVCAATGRSCRATGTSPILTGNFGTGAGLPSTQTLWWIALIILLVVIVAVVAGYAIHRHHKNEAFRREAMRWVRRWQDDPDAKGKDPKKIPTKPPAPHEQWQQPIGIRQIRDVPDPFENLPVVTDTGMPGLGSRNNSVTSGIGTFQPRRQASISDELNLPGGHLNRPVLPPLIPMNSGGLPTGAPKAGTHDLPPLKQLRQPNFGPGLVSSLPPRKLLPIGGANYDPAALPTGAPGGGNRPALPPLRPSVGGDGDVFNSPSPPPISLAPVRRPSRKRVMRGAADSQSSGMFENMTATDTQTGESATATAESEPNSGSSNPALLSDTSGGGTDEAPIRSPAKRPILSPMSKRTSVNSPEELGFQGGPGAPAPPRSMRRPSLGQDPFMSAGLPRQMSQLSRQGSVEGTAPFQLPSPPANMSRPVSRQPTTTSLLGQTGRTLPRQTSGAISPTGRMLPRQNTSGAISPTGRSLTRNSTSGAISPTGRAFNRQSTGQFAAPPRNQSVASAITNRFQYRPPDQQDGDGEGDGK